MTLPFERTYSVNMTRDFLLALINPQATPGVPRPIRSMAASCLRHFPSNLDLRRAAVGDEVFDIAEATRLLTKGDMDGYNAMVSLMTTKAKSARKKKKK